MDSENEFFRLLIAPAPTGDEPTDDMAQWVSLPCSREKLDEFADSFDTKIEDMVYYDFQSALPCITSESFGEMKRIDELNALAEKLSAMYRYKILKLKAVMEHENITGITETLECIKMLHNYEHRRSITDYSEFGREYLARNLPTNFDVSALDNIDLSEFGKAILEKKHSNVTQYGVISGRGYELFTTLTEHPEQYIEEEFEEELEEESQDLGIEMGLM